MLLFSFTSYRTYLKSYLAHLPRKGRGELAKIATYLKIQSTLLSMILSGDRDLSIEHAYDLSRYLQHSEKECEYFMLLVQHARAGNHRFKSYLNNSIQGMRTEAMKPVNRIAHEKRLDEETRAVYYSSWIYCAIRLYCSTHSRGRSIQEMADRFRIKKQRIVNAVGFLVSSGLILESETRYKMGDSRVFIEQGSPHLPKHHMNWRAKSLQKIDTLLPSELMFTFPLSISEEDFQKLKEDLMQILEKTSLMVKESPAEDVACLNIDFFWVE